MAAAAPSAGNNKEFTVKNLNTAVANFNGNDRTISVLDGTAGFKRRFDIALVGRLFEVLNEQNPEDSGDAAALNLTEGAVRYLTQEVKSFAMALCQGVPHFLSVMFRLEQFNAVNCSSFHFSTLPSTLSLEYIHVESSEITEIPRCLAMYSNLHTLALERNKITQLPHWLHRLYSLKVLDVRYNHMVTPPIEQLQIGGLTHFRYAGNPFVEIINEEVRNGKHVYAAPLRASEFEESKGWEYEKWYFIWERAKLKYNLTLLANGLIHPNESIYDRNVLNLVKKYMTDTPFYDGQEEKKAAGKVPWYTGGLGDTIIHEYTHAALRRVRKAKIEQHTERVMELYRSRFGRGSSAEMGVGRQTTRYNLDDERYQSNGKRKKKEK